MKNIVYVCLVFLALACNKKSDVKEKVNFEIEGDTIVIPDNSILKEKIIVEAVKSKSFQNIISTSGIVKAIPTNYAEIAAPFSGRVTKSYVRLGQRVDVGSPIFEISSPDFVESCKIYFQSKQEMKLAEKNMNRQSDLHINGVGIEKDLEEAEVNYELSKRDYENAKASLTVFRVNTDEVVLGQPLIIRSPIKGEIVENNIVIGQYMREDADPIATVAELSKIWVAGQVKEKDIRYIKENSDVDIKLISFPEKDIKGSIYHIQSLIDEETRSAQVLIECDNKDEIMKPGMYVTVKFTHNITNAMIIPSHAIFQMDDNSYVFIKTSTNKYLKRKVKILTENEDSIVVKSGLKKDDEIIVNGGFYLLSEK